MDAKTIYDALEAWDALGDMPLSSRELYYAEQALIDAVDAAIKSINGVDGCQSEAGSIGSRYWEIDVVDGYSSLKLRVSNHNAGKRAGENDADIVAGDSVAEIERQLDRLAAAVKASQEEAKVTQ